MFTPLRAKGQADGYGFFHYTDGHTRVNYYADRAACNASETCRALQLELLQTRLNNLTQNFYTKIMQYNDCLNELYHEEDLNKLKCSELFNNFT